MEKRGASLPNYRGGYFDAQYREALGSAIVNVMEKKYGTRSTGRVST
jgi:hypothetical protein